MAWAPQDLVEHRLWNYCCNATDMQTSLYGSPDPSLQNMVEGLHFSPVLSIPHSRCLQSISAVLQMGRVVSVPRQAEGRK